MRRADALDLFERERAAFADHWPRNESLASARLVIVPARCPGGASRCAGRDLALADLDTARVYLAARALELPRANVLGLFRHELGHLADPTPDAPGAERRADRLAFEARGERIRYDARLVQTVGRPGVWPRPPRLHR